MKKHLLLAAAGLMGCVASVTGQSSDSNYSVGMSIGSLEELESGIYIIQGYAKDGSNHHEGVLRSTESDSQAAATVDKNTKLIPSTYDEAILWEVTVTPADGENPKTFTVKSVKEGYYWSFCGSSNKEIEGKAYVNGSIIKTDGTYSGNDYENLKNGDSDVANLTFAEYVWSPSSGADPQLQEGTRFVVVSTDGLLHANNRGIAMDPGTPALNMTTNDDVSWWNITADDSGAAGTQAWLQFLPVQIAANPVDVTFVYPKFGDFTPSPVTAQAIAGTLFDAASVPAPEFFTVTEVKGEVGSDASVLEVEGEWTFPFVLDNVYRLNIRDKETRFTLDPYAVHIVTNSYDGFDFDPANLFYVKGCGFDENNRLCITVHTIARPDAEGLQCMSESRSIAAFSTEEPVQWVVKHSTHDTDGVALQHPDNVNVHINDIDDTVGVWESPNSLNNDGSFIRFFPLTEEDFATETREYDGQTYYFNYSLMKAVEENPTSANVRALFDPENLLTSGVTEVNAEGGNAGTVYDLQGRRLGAPVRGVNIIDGKKMLLNR